MKSKVLFLGLVICCAYFLCAFTDSNTAISVNGDGWPINIPAIMAMGIGIIILIGAAILIPGIVCVWLFLRIFRKAGYPAALGLLMILPVVNIVMLLVLAFIDWPLYDKFAVLSEQELDTLDEPIESDVPAQEESRIKLNKNSLSQIKETEPAASNETGLPLPLEGGDIQEAPEVKADNALPRVNLGVRDNSKDSGKAESVKEPPKTKEPEIKDMGSGGLNLGEADKEKRGAVSAESAQAGEVPKTKGDELALPEIEDEAEISLPELDDTELKMPELDEDEEKLDKKEGEDKGSE
ncbi:MAG: hypothetical protein KAU12_02225 [Candidatus Omnitrophica bacterium]|nr:hypothetical protein [Candidatus Omnitrophota bacterium]